MQCYNKEYKSPAPVWTYKFLFTWNWGSPAGSDGGAAVSVLRENQVTWSLTFGIPDLQKTFPLTCLFNHDMQQRTQYSNTKSLKNRIMHKNDSICLISQWPAILSYLHCYKCDIIVCFPLGYSCTEIINVHFASTKSKINCPSSTKKKRRKLQILSKQMLKLYNLNSPPHCQTAVLEALFQ